MKIKLIFLSLLFAFLHFEADAIDYKFMLWDTDNNTSTVFQLEYRSDFNSCYLIKCVDFSLNLIDQVLEDSEKKSEIKEYNRSFVLFKKICVLGDFAGKIKLPNQIRENWENYKNSILFYENEEDYIIINVPSDLGGVLYFSPDFSKVFRGFGGALTKSNYDRLFKNLKNPKEIGKCDKWVYEIERSKFGSIEKTFYDYLHQIGGFENPLMIRNKDKEAFLPILRQHFPNSRVEKKDINSTRNNDYEYSISECGFTILDQYVDFMTISFDSNGQISWAYHFNFDKSFQVKQFTQQVLQVMKAMAWPLKKEKDLGNEVYYVTKESKKISDNVSNNYNCYIIFSPNCTNLKTLKSSFIKVVLTPQ